MAKVIINTNEIEDLIAGLPAISTLAKTINEKIIDIHEPDVSLSPATINKINDCITFSALIDDYAKNLTDKLYVTLGNSESVDINNKCENSNSEDVILEGVGKDAETVTNENGGKQSKSPMSAHLLDPMFLATLTNDYQNNIYNSIFNIANFMINENKERLLLAANFLEPNKTRQLVEISKVLDEGAKKYDINNWRLIPQEQHINHALIHLLAADLGDKQDNHIEHALCRIMMAYATKPSIDFSYTKFIKK